MTKNKILTLVFLCTLLALGTAIADAEARRIAVAADGADIKASVDSRTARAPFILIFDGNGELIESHKNPVTRDRGAGPELAGWLVEKNVDTLIGGDIGPNLAQAIGARNISWAVKSGPVSEAVMEVLR
jgi:predicted Fe-Mo cluster-binding NifX family protein